MKSLVDEGRATVSGIRSVSSYVPSDVAPTILSQAGFKETDVFVAFYQTKFPTPRLPADQIDKLLNVYSHAWKGLLGRRQEVDAVLEARPTRVRRFKARVRHIKGSRELAEADSAFTHLV